LGFRGGGKKFDKKGSENFKQKLSET